MCRLAAAASKVRRQAEDGRSGPVALAPAGGRAAFGAALPGRRVVYGTLSADASVLSVRLIAADGGGEQILGEFPAGQYLALRGAWEVDGRIVVQLTAK